jgi:hypothetical protein
MRRNITNNMIRTTILTIAGFFAITAGTAHFSQAVAQQQNYEYSEFEQRRKSILDANELRATYHNYGFGGRTNENNRDELFYEYPKNTNRRYIYFVSIFTGAEVRNQGGTGNQLFPVVVAPNYRTNPQTGDSWAQNPIVGYYNENSEELARSDRGPNSPLGNTWPEFWPDKMTDEGDPGWRGQWNGFFGKGIFNADQEFYYRSGDDLYTRYVNNPTSTFRPDNNNPERGGLGLIMDSRILAWTQNLISGVHFNIFEIRNDASFDYDKVSFMLWTADWVGTPSDDRPFFDQQRSTAFFTDTRPIFSPAEFDGTAIGVAGIRFLETPGNAIDGIDNDGDSDFYIPSSNLYDNRNADLITPLTTAGGGFFASNNYVTTNIVPLFEANSFNERTLSPGDPIVLIDERGNRILTRYPNSTENVVVVSQGREITLFAGGMTVREDTLNGRHLNLLDDDLDGLIDENQPNHLTLSRILPNGTELTRPVRHINYLYSGFYNNIVSFADRDTIQRGLVVPNSWIRDRMQNDNDFRNKVVDYQEMLKTLYAGRLDTSQFDHYFQNHHTSAPMIDESREDFFDNNMNWTAGADDVGIDGVEGTGARGEGDGFPSSGAFTPFPGESNIDKTDVAETDAIGITSATFRPAGGLNLSGADADIWQTHMLPGMFSAAPDASQDTDQFITSSFFPLQKGGVERFAIAITVAQANTPTNAADIELVENNLRQAFNAYQANYQFATAPPPPVLKAVPGNGRVTLYWDDKAEFAFDRYLERLGVNPNNFEGYKVYRSTDPALLDARKITDGRGNLQFLKPIAQFDRINGIKGNHPIDINGLDYYLGNDTGLQRYYVDTDVINGRQYYYAVTAYNSGAATAGIAPAESPVNLSINPDGTLVAGVNVIEIIPRATSAGYVGPEPPILNKVAGTGTGFVFAEIVDPRALHPGDSYRVTFRDTTLAGETFAYAYSLTNTTTDSTLLRDREIVNVEDSPVVQGIRLTIRTDTTVGKLHPLSWKSDSGLNADATMTSTTHVGTDENYLVVFMAPSNTKVTSEATIRRNNVMQRISATESNVRVINVRTGEEVPFALRRANNIPVLQSRNATFASYFDNEVQRNYSDLIYILNEQNEVAYELEIHPHTGKQVFYPMEGDVIELVQSGEFTSSDVYEFTIDPNSNVAKYDAQLAKSQLDQIRVVPNPYIVTNLVERRPTPVRPQQERQLHFINLPSQCTIRIFNVAGQLVQTLNVNNSMDNGLKVWDMLTKDNLDLAYGIYVYHVEAPGIGEYTGKFAVIK